MYTHSHTLWEKSFANIYIYWIGHGAGGHGFFISLVLSKLKLLIFGGYNLEPHVHISILNESMFSNNQYYMHIINWNYDFWLQKNSFIFMKFWIFSNFQFSNSFKSIQLGLILCMVIVHNTWVNIIILLFKKNLKKKKF